MTTETETTNLIVTPVSTLVFAALRQGFISKKYPKKDKQGNTVPVYKARIHVDGTTTEGKAFADVVTSVEASKLITRPASGETLSDGHFAFNATTVFQPKVTNADGVELKGEDIPYFDGRYDTAQVRLLLKPDTSGVKGTFHLLEVQILEMTTGDRPEGTGTTSKKTSIADLVAKAKS